MKTNYHVEQASIVIVPILKNSYVKPTIQRQLWSWQQIADSKVA